jgi:cation diffusion facilitator family transporter
MRLFLPAFCRQDKYSYPVGKKRLEPLGIIVFSTLMFTTALQILIEAFKRLSNHSTKINIEVYTLAGLIITITLKLLLYLYCRTVSGSSSVEALAQDHRNDVISNSVTIATALVAFYKPDLWYFDPIGGVAIGLYIMVVWVRTGFLTVRMMTGYVAPPDLIKKWTYLAMQHDPKVVAIDTVRGYHTSEGFVVELDIVLPEEMPLKEAHDIGEALQFKVEGLEEVERCFVHLDYETDHKPEH